MSTLILNSHGLNTNKGTAQIKAALKEQGIDSFEDKTIFAVLYPEDELEDDVIDNLTTELGFKPGNIYLSKDGWPDGNRPDIVYVTEGNTFDIRNHIFDSSIATNIYLACKTDPESIYIGSSAGAMIAGTDVFLAKDFDSVSVSYIDSYSLKLFDGTIIPHCTEEGLANYLSMKEAHVLARYNNIYSVSDEEVMVIKDDQCHKKTITTDYDRSRMRVAAVKFFGPSTEKELMEISFYVNDESLQRFYQSTAGCIVINSLGEVDIYSIGAIINYINNKKQAINLIPIGLIKNKGILYINKNGNIFLFESKHSTAVRQRWDNIEELLELHFMS